MVNIHKYSIPLAQLGEFQTALIPAQVPSDEYQDKKVQGNKSPMFVTEIEQWQCKDTPHSL